ncbi:MAG: DnaD domain protein [Bacillales bacterium]|nr:DnaD domain protein [Bacillales bacterium]
MKMMHLYGCESCKLDFAVSTNFVETEKIVCPVCNTDTKMIDHVQEVKYRILRKPNEAKEVNLYQIFEQEFGRMLSPFETQMIMEWNGRFHTDVIKLALREAIIRNVKQMKYIDRILLNWEQAGVTTVAEAMNISKRYERKIKVDSVIQTTTRENVPDGFFYNWLEEEAK